MQAERGGSRPHREGARHGRRRPGGVPDAATDRSGGDGYGRGGGGGRGRGGAYGHRGGGGRGRREPRGRGAAPPASTQQHRRVEEDDDTESRHEEEKEELKSYSRRKIFSNWSRYEDTEKEGQSECGESQRGTDFSVLLSSADNLLGDKEQTLAQSASPFANTKTEDSSVNSCSVDHTEKVNNSSEVLTDNPIKIQTQTSRKMVYVQELEALQNAQMESDYEISLLRNTKGDSFAQFRFADEKEWDKESICHKQFSALSVDCQSLVQALQELPLHLRLNVAADLVQASTPLEIPQIKSKIFEDGKKREQLFRQSLAQSETMLVSHPVSNSVAPSEPGSKNGSRPNGKESFQRVNPLSNQDTDHLDEELDLLLNLEAPINTKNGPAPGALSCSISTEKDLKMDCKENEPLKVDMPEEKSTSSQQQQSASKDVTEEELEDWLDSMSA